MTDSQSEWKKCWFLVMLLNIKTVGTQDLYFCETGGEDPCKIANEKAPYEPVARYESCEPNQQYCDRYIIPGWYRYNERMLEHCPSLGTCGTVYPSWLNGTHPKEDNSEVVRTVCKVGFASCCERKISIKIRNCGQFMAYCLPALESCPERYCFGESGPCTLATSVTTDVYTTFTSSAITTTKQITSATNEQATRTTSEPPQSTSTNFAITTTGIHIKSTSIDKSDELSHKPSILMITIMAVIIGIIIVVVIGLLVIIYRMCYQQKMVREDTYEQPFTTLAASEYEIPAYTNKNEKGNTYEELPANGLIKDENPYEKIDEESLKR